MRTMRDQVRLLLFLNIMSQTVILILIKEVQNILKKLGRRETMDRNLKVKHLKLVKFGRP